MNSVETLKINPELDQLRNQYIDYFVKQYKKLQSSFDSSKIVDEVLDKKTGEKIDLDKNDIQGLVLNSIMGAPGGIESLFTAVEAGQESEQDVKFKKQLADYLSQDNFWDGLEDKLWSNKKYAFLLQDNKDLYEQLKKVREYFIVAQTTGKLEDLKSFLEGLDMDDNPDVTVDDKDFQQDTETVIEKTVDLTGKEQILLEDMRSEKYLRNATTGVTWCSKCARMNAENFGITVPKGNAVDAMKAPVQDTDHFVQTLEASQGATIQDIHTIDKDANCGDVFVASKGKYGKYGHRCWMFENGSDGKWYVLDPYRQPNPASKTNPSSLEGLKPKPLDEYMKHNSILKINFYNSPKVVVNTVENVANSPA